MRRFVTFAPAAITLLTAVLLVFVAPDAIRRLSHANTEARIELASQTLETDNVLEAINRAIEAIAEKVRPSVVHIEVTRSTSSGLSRPSGSGWVFDADGHIVTNAHVVYGAERARVSFSDGSVATGSIVGSDALTDIAVVKVDLGSGVFPLDRASGRQPRQGERVFAFGSPFGFRFSMTEGIISGLGRAPTTVDDYGTYTNFIQHDAAVNPGNSGGPLVDVYGRLVGMNAAIATGRGQGNPEEDNTGDSAGISFAIPVGTIEPVVTQLIRFGRVERGFLGVYLSDEPAPVAGVAGTTALTGAGIERVNPGSPAADAGLRASDIVVEVDGYKVSGRAGLQSLVASRRPGDVVRLGVVRDGRVEPIAVTLGALPDESVALRVAQRIVPELGVRIIEEGPDGPTVVEVRAGGLGFRQGFRVGQVITAVEGEPVRTAIDYYVALGRGGILEGRAVEVRVRARGVPDGGITTTLRASLVP